MSVNKVILVGRLGADPESRNTNSGTTVTNLRIATSERKKNGDSGEWTEHTEWHRVVTFGRQAETCSQHLSKGRQVYVEGRIRTRKWQDKDGNDRYSTEIIGDRVQFLGSKDGGGNAHGGGNSYGGSGYGGGGYGASSPTSAPQQADDIPFCRPATLDDLAVLA